MTIVEIFKQYGIVTTHEGAKITGVKQQTIQQWIYRKKLTAHKLERDYILLLDDLINLAIAMKNATAGK